MIKANLNKKIYNLMKFYIISYYDIIKLNGRKYYLLLYFGKNDSFIWAFFYVLVFIVTKRSFIFVFKICYLINTMI